MRRFRPTVLDDLQTWSMIASVTGTAILGATKMERTDRQQLLFLSAIAEVLCGILWADRLVRRRRRKRRRSMVYTPDLSIWSDDGFIIEVERVGKTNRSLLSIHSDNTIVILSVFLYFASALRGYARMRLIDFDRFLRDHATAYKILISKYWYWSWRWK